MQSSVSAGYLLVCDSDGLNCQEVQFSTGIVDGIDMTELTNHRLAISYIDVSDLYRPKVTICNLSGESCTKHNVDNSYAGYETQISQLSDRKIAVMWSNYSSGLTKGGVIAFCDENMSLCHAGTFITEQLDHIDMIPVVDPSNITVLMTSQITNNPHWSQNGAFVSVGIVEYVCIPNWGCTGYTDCTINDTIYCNNVEDTMQCNTTYTGDYMEFGTNECDFCTPSWSCATYGDCISGIKNCTAVTDANDCYETTGVEADNFNGSLESYQLVGCVVPGTGGSGRFPGEDPPPPFSVAQTQETEGINALLSEIPLIVWLGVTAIITIAYFLSKPRRRRKK
jgi:hypothetical protein